MKTILKIRKKGILILPKALREKSGIKEGDHVAVEARKGIITIKPLKPKVVNVNPQLLDKLLSEETRLEKGKHGR